MSGRRTKQGGTESSSPLRKNADEEDNGAEKEEAFVCTGGRPGAPAGVRGGGGKKPAGGKKTDRRGGTRGPGRPWRVEKGVKLYCTSFRWPHEKRKKRRKLVDSKKKIRARPIKDEWKERAMNERRKKGVGGER